MQKLKKYIYPFIFSICFFATYMILAIVLELVLPSGDYAGLAYAGIALVLWISVVMPCYCIKYCKLIHKEKLKFLFAIYNPLVVTFCYSFPFLKGADSSSFGITLKIAVFLFIWVAIWSFVPLVIRLDSTEKQDDNISNETQE